MHTTPNIMRTIFVPVSLFFLFTLAFNIALGLVLISLVLTYRIFHTWLDPDIFDSRTTRILLTPFFYILILQCVVLFGWAINRNFPLDMSISLCAVFLFFLYAYTSYFRARNKIGRFAGNYTSINSSDYLSLAVATAVILTVVLVPFFVGGFSNKSSVLGLMNGNVDDGSHLSLINDRLHFNRGILYHADIAGQARSGPSYPAGWNSANAVIMKAAHPSIKPSVQSLYAYLVSKVFWFFILVFVFAKTMFIFYKFLGPRNRFVSATTLWLFSCSTLLSSAFLVDFFNVGFYSFMPQSITILLLGITAMQVVRARERPSDFQSTLPLLALLVISGSLPWLLLLPAFIVAGCTIIIWHLRYSDFKSSLKQLLKSVICYGPLYLLLAGALLVQYYAFGADESSVSFLQGILLNGSTPIYSNMFYIFLLIGLALCVALVKKQLGDHLKSVFVLIVSLLTLSFIIYGLQIIYLSQNAYYYYKIVSGVLVLALPLAAVGYALGFEWVARKKDSALAILSIGLFLLVLIPQLALLPVQVYLSGKRPISKKLNESVYLRLEHDSTTQRYQDRTYIFYYVPDAILQNEIATVILKSNKPNSACFNSTRSAFNTLGGFPRDIDNIRRDCAGQYKLSIITDEANVKKLNGIVDAAKLNETITVKVDN